MDFITSKQMYIDALKLFHVEIKQVQKGHLVFVADGNGNPVRYPIKMSDFQKRPRYYQAEVKAESIKLDDNYLLKESSKKEMNITSSSMLFDLIHLIPYNSIKIFSEIKTIDK